MPVMRRLFAVNLLVALLGPWIAALSGSTAPLVPCPMHHAGTAGSHTAHTMAAPITAQRPAAVTAQASAGGLVQRSV